MLQVDCPACQASYEVDRNRLPDKGLKMRCPKCGESFRVLPDGSTGAVELAAAPKPPLKRKKTQVGLGPPSVPPPAPALELDSAAKVDPIDEIDLPAPMPVDDGLADLPAPRGGLPAVGLNPFDDLPESADLPAPKRAKSSRGFDPFADIDLPAPLEADGGVDLPAPLESSTSGAIDLPAVKHRTDDGFADLPAVKESGGFGEEIDLPMALSDAELPAPMSVDFDLPTPLEHSDLPTPFGQQDLPKVRDDFSEPPDSVDRAAGPLELDLPDGDNLSLETDIDPGVRRQAPPPLQPAGAPSDPEIEVADDLEFSELPSLPPGVPPGGVERMPHPGRAEGASAPSPARVRKIDVAAKVARKRPAWLGKAIAAVMVGGLILGSGFFLGKTKYGLFGVHLIEPFLPGAGDAVQVEQQIKQAEKMAGSDSYGSSRDALTFLDQAREQSPLNRALIARSLLHESYFQRRYGVPAPSADALRVHLSRRGDEAPGIHVALAANALRQGDGALAKTELALAKTEDPTDPYVDLVAGQAALEANDGQAALSAFEAAFKKDGSARAQWGLARAHRLLGAEEEALAAAEATLELSPNHAGALVAIAEKTLVEGDYERAYELAQRPAGLADTAGGANTDRSAALTVVARVDEHAGRLGAARTHYEQAVKLDSSNVEAALGAARLVLQEGGYADALARFQSVLSATIPPGAALHVTGQPRLLVEAKLGAVQALLAMDKAGDARALVTEFETEQPVSADVEIAQGLVAASLEDTREATRHLRNAIRLEPTSFTPYIALAQHYKDTQRPAEAVAVLVEAQKNVEITPRVRRLLAEAELERNRFDEAIVQYEAALATEPRDSAAQFGLALAYRRKAALDEAAAALAKVEELDPNFPGLALEKGRLAEARGDMVGAVVGYRAAIANAPNDTTLQSRLGAVLVTTGEFAEAETVLAKVLEAEPYSAEAEHYLGRIELQRGDLITARQRFLRASRLDPKSGLYRMYVAWAALESNEMNTALADLNRTLELDPSLGDAYWLRARIRLRAGTVRDALADLQKAIALNPGRVEAWAAIGECHYQLGQMGQAIAALQKALEGNPGEGYWWYRLGRLQVDEAKRSDALGSLIQAAELGDASPETPSWLADAHRLLGDVYFAQRNQTDASIHYGRYLEMSGPDALDRADVQSKLQRIGTASR